MRGNITPVVMQVLQDMQMLAFASGILMEIDQSTPHDASVRLAYLATRFHISVPDMALALVESRP